MSDRLLCFDSDVFAIFAVADRLEYVIDLLGFTWEDTRRLHAIVPMLRKGRKFEQFSAAQKDIVLAAAQKVTPLDYVPADVGIKDRLAVPHIDVGEQLLIAAVAERPLYWLASGDKEAMRVLCRTPGLEDVKRSVSSRVVSLEGVMYAMFQRDGYAKTLEAFTDLRTQKTLRCFFPEQPPPPPADPLEGPKSYLRYLCSELGRGFLHCPPCPDSVKGICTIAAE